MLRLNNLIKMTPDEARSHIRFVGSGAVPRTVTELNHQLDTVANRYAENDSAESMLMAQMAIDMKLAD
jgi:hypothetical protein